MQQGARGRLPISWTTQSYQGRRGKNKKQKQKNNCAFPVLYFKKNITNNTLCVDNELSDSVTDSSSCFRLHVFCLLDPGILQHPSI